MKLISTNSFATRPIENQSYLTTISKHNSTQFDTFQSTVSPRNHFFFKHHFYIVNSLCIYKDEIVTFYDTYICKTVRICNPVISVAKFSKYNPKLSYLFSKLENFGNSKKRKFRLRSDERIGNDWIIDLIRRSGFEAGRTRITMARLIGGSR